MAICSDSNEIFVYNIGPNANHSAVEEESKEAGTSLFGFVKMNRKAIGERYLGKWTINTVFRKKLAFHEDESLIVVSMDGYYFKMDIGQGDNPTNIQDNTILTQPITGSF